MLLLLGEGRKGGRRVARVSRGLLLLLRFEVRKVAAG